MKPEIRVSKADYRSLSREDFARIVELEKNCGLDDPYDPALLRRLFIYADNFVCRLDGKIAGFITLSPDSLYLGGSVYIVNINVAREHRGRRLAKHLMLTACEYYIERLPDLPVSLDVMKTNPAMNLYHSVGFRVVNIPSRNGNTDVVMAAPLRLLEQNLRSLLARQEC